MNAKILALATIYLGLVALSFILSYPLMLLWNGCLVPAVAGVSEVSWLQTWGLVILFHFMFGTSVSKK